MTIAKDGLKFLLPALAAAIAFLALGWWPAAVPFLLLTLAFAFFFRDPRRAVPSRRACLRAASEHEGVQGNQNSCIEQDTQPGDFKDKELPHQKKQAG